MKIIKHKTFNLLLFGDFSGSHSKGVIERVEDQKPISIDRDNFDAVVSNLKPKCQPWFVDDDRPPMHIQMEQLEDFHPDPLIERVEVFQKFRHLLKNVGDPDSFLKAAAILVNGNHVEPLTESPDTPEKTEANSAEIMAEPESLLDQILDESNAAPVKKDQAIPSSDWDAFLHKIVHPHLIPKKDPREPELKEAVEAAISDVMRSILHDRAFQQLEANWRGLYWLVSRLQTDEALKIYLVDVSKEELARDLFSTDNPEKTGIFNLLKEQTVNTPESEPWTVLAGCYHFGPYKEDAEMLKRLATVCEKAGIPFLTGAEDRMLGCASLADTPDPEDWKDPFESENDRAAWESLRQSTESLHIGMVLPRFLLRLPYGKETDPTEMFEFEEMGLEPVHSDYLWGHPAIAAAYLLGESFSRFGSEFRPGALQEIEDLPLHVFKRKGAPEVKPPAEVFLSESAAKAILAKGIMPLLSMKDRDFIRLARFQSIADPPTALAGPWSK